MFRILIFLSVLCAMVGCDLKDAKLLDQVVGVRDSLKLKYAPDQRVALFQIDMAFQNGVLLLSGRSDQPEAIKALLLSLNEKNIKVKNRVVSLPDSSVGETNFGVINNSVANIRSDPRHSAELATQALLGTEVRILQILDEWYLIQTPDGYISWVDHGGIQLMTDMEVDDWRGAKKVIMIKNQSEVIDELKVGDVVLGNILKWVDETDKAYYVGYPDGRKGWISKSDAEVFDTWKNETTASGELLEKYALDLIGSPYLWGGTSTKGLDCSGFTKTVYFMNGLIIPRDASQQVNEGTPIEAGDDFENLRKGDLVFFGRVATDSTKQKVTHVGLWLGDKSFIHSSMRVKMSSFDSVSENYDEYNLNRYLGARRYLGQTTFGIKAL